MVSDAVPVAGLVVNFSPMDRIAPPPFGSDGDGAETTWNVCDGRALCPCVTPGAGAAADSGDGRPGITPGVTSGGAPRSRAPAGSCPAGTDDPGAFGRRSSKSGS